MSTLEEYSDLSSLSTEELEKLELNLRGFEEEPVDIETFIFNKYFLGNYFSGARFSPHWLDFLNRIYEKKIDAPAFLIFERGSIGRGKCVSANTLIKILDNNIKELTIEELYNIYKNDSSKNLYVKSYNFKTGKFEPDRVKKVIYNGFRTAQKITLSNGSEIICTRNHRLLTSEDKWVTVDCGLAKGVSLKTTSKTQVIVESIDYCGHGKMYDLETENNHNYLLSSNVISHNSTTACIGALYDQYMLMCLKSPQEYFGLVPTEQIVLFIMNVTLGLSEKVLMGKINDMINNSPYFSEKQQTAISLRKKRKLETKTRFPKGIDIRSGSRVSHTLGTAIHCLSKDTLIPLFGNFELTVQEIYERFQNREILFTFSLDTKRKDTVSGLITNVFDNGIQDVYRIVLDNNKFIDCTLNHRLLGIDNEYHDLSSLKIGDTLLAFDYFNSDGIRRWIDPYESGNSRTIINIEYLGKQSVYDIEVNKYHNFALSSGVYSHNSAILSEAAFSIYNNQFMEAFNSILARQESRFLADGKSSGRIWIDSSEKDTGSILNELCDKYRDKPGVIIDAGPLWEIRPWNYGVNHENKFCDFFYVYKGSDREPASFINMNDTNQIARLANDEPNSILVVPEEHRIRFEADIEEALRDLGGVATASKYRLFRNMKMLIKAFQGMPLYDDVIELDFYNQSDQIINHCKLPQYFDHLPSPNSMRYIHVDIGVSGDKLGFAMTYISGRKDVEVQKDITNINTNKTVDSMITTITELAFSIKNKAGQQVPLNKVRVFIKWLKDKGVLIGGVSSDSFQSASMLQEMKLIGIESSVISVDRTSDPYIYLRNSIYEGRSILPSNNLLRKELENLEISPDGSKVDHPDVFPGGIEVGSKDVADAVCMAYDTKLFSLSGNNLTVEQLYNMGWKNEYIISYDLETGFAYPQKVKSVIRNNIPESLLRITLSDKSYFDVTDDHLVLTLDKVFVEAKNLTNEHKLISLAESAKKYYNYNSRSILSGADGFKKKRIHTKTLEGEMVIADLSNILYFSTPIASKKIVSIERIPNKHYVYDLQLEDIHNFAISNLIFLHNCGSTYNCFKNQNKFNLLDALSSQEASNMILYSSPDIDESQLNLLEEGKSKSPLINNIVNQWSGIKQTEESDPYLDYLKTLEFMGSKDPSGDSFSNYIKYPRS